MLHSAMSALIRHAEAATTEVADVPGRGDLLSCLSAVSDPRKRRGVRLRSRRCWPRQWWIRG
jgi:hypothetical protein